MRHGRGAWAGGTRGTSALRVEAVQHAPNLLVSTSPISTGTTWALRQLLESRVGLGYHICRIMSSHANRSNVMMKKVPGQHFTRLWVQKHILRKPRDLPRFPAAAFWLPAPVRLPCFLQQMTGFTAYNPCSILLAAWLPESSRRSSLDSASLLGPVLPRHRHLRGDHQSSGHRQLPKSP